MLISVSENITEALVDEIIKRNPAYQFAEDLPQIEGPFSLENSDDFGFSLVCDVPFGQLNYLLSLVIGEPFQSGENADGELHNSYSCKLQKIFGHLIEKSVYRSEIIILQDSDIKPGVVNTSMNLANHVDEVIGEVGKELSGLMKKLQAKNKSNK